MSRHGDRGSRDGRGQRPVTWQIFRPQFRAEWSCTRHPIWGSLEPRHGWRYVRNERTVVWHPRSKFLDAVAWIISDAQNVPYAIGKQGEDVCTYLPDAVKEIIVLVGMREGESPEAVARLISRGRRAAEAYADRYRALEVLSR